MRRQKAQAAIAVVEEKPPLAIPQLDQTLFYRNTIREFDRGPHDPYVFDLGRRGVRG